MLFSIKNNNEIKNNDERKNILKKIYDRPYTFFKRYYNSVIPLKIYQTWITKNLPPKMKECVESLKNKNPRFEYFLFDDNDCREFIKTHFRPDVLNAYDNLIPGAYKADLWRCCVLFINGGIYIDIKFNCVNGFKLIELTEKEHFVKDRVPPLSIHNALMVCKAGNPFLLRCIRTIVNNVNNKFYGSSPLDPTGPILLGNIILKNNLKLNIDMAHHNEGGYIIYKNRFIISTEYNEYDSERRQTYKKINLKHYSELWNERNIYK
jgi:mannosyltransferase OCH1-like enzyme